MLILLDAGHGGKDPGAVGNGLKEKDITLDICKRIEAGLKAYENVKVVMTRTTDIFLSLDERTNKANQAKADIFLSVHVNAASAAARGFESYIYPKAPAATVAFQNVLHSEILKQIGTGVTDRGKKQKDLHVLRESIMDAVLTENLFISNAADAALLANADFRQRLANGHILGLEKFLGFKKGAQPPPAPSTPPITEEGLWVVQVGAFKERANADALSKQLFRDGYKPFIKKQ